MQFNNPDNEIVADLLDAEPPVITGYTYTEFFASIAANLIIWITLFSLLLLPFGQVMIGVVLGVIVAAACIVYLGKWLERNKENKPNGYFSLKLFVAINKVLPLGFVIRDGQWEINRDR